MKQPVTACIIVRNDPHLRKTIESIAPHVSEIVVVCTGHVRDVGAVFEIAEKVRSMGHTIMVAQYTSASDKNYNIENFAKARNHSFSWALQPWILWIDSDDEFTGELPDLSNYSEIPNTCIVCPYEYAYDDKGNCTSYQMRERIIRKSDGWEWRKRVHEGLFLKDGIINEVKWDKAIWKHRRPDAGDSIERNYRLLKLDYANMSDNARVCYDYGIAALQNKDNEAGIVALKKAFELSAWAEEQASITCRMIDYWLNKWADTPLRFDHIAELREWSARAIEKAPHLPSSYAYACEIAARCSIIPSLAYPEAIGDVIRYGEMALSLKDNKGRFFSNPQQLELNIPLHLHMAALHQNDGKKAKLYIDQCVQARPNDSAIQNLKWSLESQKPGFIPKQPTVEWDVVFACMPTPEAWGPDSIDKGGIGGSETAVIHMARQLSFLGLRVAVYAGIDAEIIDCPIEGDKEARVAYKRIERIGEVKHTKLLVGWRHAAMLETCPADERWLWVHDVSPLEVTPWRMHLSDKVLVLSTWHKQNLLNLCLPGEKIEFTRNGIDLKRFARTDIKRNKLKAVYTSSIDRGLDDLLEMWPTIVAGVHEQIGKKPELHVYYGDKFVPTDFSRHIRKKMRELGVVNHGRLGQQDLADELLSASAWLYPTNFNETFCISAYEAIAAGLCTITYDRAALADLPSECGAIKDGDRDTFISSAIQFFVTMDGIQYQPDRSLSDEIAAEYSWTKVAEQWKGWFDKIETKPFVELVQDNDRPVLNLYLAESASGSVIFDPTDPDIIKIGGGFRDGFIGLAKAMAALGDYRVRGASTWSKDHQLGDGVEWISLSEIQRFGTPDIALAYYDTSPLIGMQGCLRIASHHTYEPFRNFAWADVNVAPSKHSMESLKARFAPTADWYVMPNGVRDEGIEWNPIHGRVIYHTSPDRGLHLLLRIWPYIKQAVPRATLHVIGNVAGMTNPKFIHPALRARYERIYNEMQLGIKECEEAGGVTFLGRVDRATLRKEIGEAACFAFPASLLAPSETFSISLMECCKAGVPVVTSDADSLREIYGEHAMVFPEIETNMIPFAETVSSLLNNHVFSQAMSKEGKHLASKYTFENQAIILNDIIKKHLS